METFTYLCRELKEPHEIVALLRIRHQSYFELNGYGPEKPFGVDLTAHDHRARHLGLFRDTELIGGFRVVFRQDVPGVAPIVRGMRAIVAPPAPELAESTLPTEEAFDLSAVGSHARLVDAEVGRLVLLRRGSCKGLSRELLTLCIAVLYALKTRLYLFSCAVERAERYAAVVKPRWRLTEPRAPGFRGFQFPEQSYAFVAAPEDSPFFERALHYADQLAACGAMHVVVDAEAVR